jgi:DDE superfamily endonuclease
VRCLTSGRRARRATPQLPQTVGDDALRSALQPAQQAFEEALGSCTIAFLLHQDVQHHPMLIHGTPEIVLHAVHADENLIHMSGIAGSWPSAAQSHGEFSAELAEPVADTFAGDDRSGALVDVPFSETRDRVAAKAFFRSAKTVTGIIPDRVTTDGHDSYPRVIRSERPLPLSAAARWSGDRGCGRRCHTQPPARGRGAVRD